MAVYRGDITEFAAYMAVVESRRQIIFVGRGTCGDANWNTDKNFTLIPNDLAEGALIHGGFQLAWSEIADSVLNTLQAAVSRYQDYDIVFTGGSLGGAVATVAGANLRAAGYDVDIYSYGSPRIGNDILSEFIQQQPGKIYRVTHNQDPVPRLPPTALFDKYRHISPEYWLHGRPEDIDHWPTDNIKICEGGWSRECIASPLNGWNLSDHQSYFGSLQCWIPGTAEDCVIPEDAQAQLLALAEADV
jgi:hypothetical protein